MIRAVFSAACAAAVLVLAGAVAAAQETQIVPGAASTPPPPGPARAVQYPAPVATTLPNGLRVLAVRVPGSALVAADTWVRTSMQYWSSFTMRAMPRTWPSTRRSAARWRSFVAV